MLDDPNDRTQRAAQAVATYIARHPMAADNAEGIAQVWLPAMGVEVPQPSLLDALELLVSQRVLRRVVLADDSVIYRAAQASNQA